MAKLLKESTEPADRRAGHHLWRASFICVGCGCEIVTKLHCTKEYAVTWEQQKICDECLELLHDDEE